MKPTLGRIVQYVISLADIEAIEAQRARMAQLLLISPGQLGNTYVPGETVPMVIARVWSDACVNGQLILDGQDTLWVTSRNRDDLKPHQSWHFPEIHGVCELRVETTSEQPLKNGSGILPDMASPDVRAALASDAHEAVSTMAAKVARLKDELSRKRQAENDLIRDRDRLIHGDLAKLHEQVKTLTAERDEAQARAERFQDACTQRDQTLANYGHAQARQQAREEELGDIIAKQTRRLHLNEDKLKSIAYALAQVD